MKEERYLKDREAIVRADIWKEITSSCKGLRTELGYTNIQIVEFLKEITKTLTKMQAKVRGNLTRRNFPKTKAKLLKDKEIDRYMDR